MALKFIYENGTRRGVPMLEPKMNLQEHSVYRPEIRRCDEWIVGNSSMNERNVSISREVSADSVKTHSVPEVIE